MSFLKPAQFSELLEAFADHPRITLGRSDRLKVDPAPLRPPLRARLQSDGALELSVQWPSDSEVLAADGRAWLLRAGRELRPVSPGLPAAYGALFEQPSLRLPPDQAGVFLTAEWRKLEAFFELRSEAGAGASSATGKTTDAPLDVQPAAPRFVLGSRRFAQPTRRAAPPRTTPTNASSPSASRLNATPSPFPRPTGPACC